eukprot:gene34316-42320_t
MYQTITTKHFTKLSVASNEDAWAIFVHILKSIADTERRVNLHLRYIRDRPKVVTTCCNAQHCFRCITKAHEGVTCEENVGNTDNAIVHCPACNISLVKGDGCDSVTCVCGHYFEWEFEKTHRVLIKEFALLYPENSHRQCVDILFAADGGLENYEDPTQNMARAWQQINYVPVNAELAAWFQRQFPHCPTQRASLLDSLGLPTSLQQSAGHMYTYAHQEDVARCKAQNAECINSLFLTMCPLEAERGLAASQLSFAVKYVHWNHSFLAGDERMKQSAQAWTSNNTALSRSMAARATRRRVEQFTYLYGSRNILSTVFMLTKCEEQWYMLRAFLAEMQTIKPKRNTFFDDSYTPVSLVACDGDEWLKANCNEVTIATERCEKCYPAVQTVLSLTHSANISPQSIEALDSMTWSDLNALLSWRRLNPPVCEEGDDEDEGYMFSLFD